MVVTVPGVVFLRVLLQQLALLHQLYAGRHQLLREAQRRRLVENKHFSYTDTDGRLAEI